MTSSLREEPDYRAAATAFEHLPVIVSMWEGAELRGVAGNRLFRASIRDRPFLGLPLREALPELAGQEVFETYERVLSTGVAEAVREWRMLHEVDGRTIEEFYTTHFTPVPDDTGTVRGVLQTGEDVTAQVLRRREAEAKAAVSQERYLAAQEVVLALQSNLLPATLPVLPAIDLAAQYAVAAAELQAGGDWFDAVPLPDGRVALVVGDVVGHGAPAAAAMAQLRPVLREALRSGVDPVGAVDRLDAHASETPATRAATVCLVVLDPSDGALTLVSRAHPAPLVCAPDGDTRYLEGGGGGPLGVGAGRSRASVHRLKPGETVLLYSDGVVERPGEPAAEGAARLARIAGGAVTTRSDAVPERTTDRLCALIVERVTRGGYVDDVTVLAAQRLVEPVAPLVLDVPAEQQALAGLRDALTAWLTALGARRKDLLAVPLAAWEAASNVVDHAYSGSRTGRLRLDASVDSGGRLRLQVADDGRWRERTASSGGRGLPLLRLLTDEVTIERRDDGTTVTMLCTLGHPTVIGLTASTPTLVEQEPFDVVPVRRDPTVLSVRGPIDASTTALLRTGTLRHGAGLEGPVVLDLEQVTFLASAGVQLLHELTHDGRVELAAPVGSLARHVLDLTGLSALSSE
ncbi:hypothetical protein ACWT_2136 [Actinoplanes sp. SE50]|nr:uncharacterized protein ACPL_2261 [Actinoplanes sp. SE50/110]ATO81551.1 hypothetical protein ACWT_2136 [Actinoplanes sp. SE50]SLL98959.1 regulator of sigma subunit, anti-anti-sigma factor RsbU [Actinoplanes sp. SE50/110]